MDHTADGYVLVSRKLDTLIRLLAISVTQEKKAAEKVQLLGLAGLPPKDIASILKMTSGSVRVALHRERHTKARRKRK